MAQVSLNIDFFSVVPLRGDIIDGPRFEIFNVFTPVFAKGDILGSYSVLTVLPTQNAGFYPRAIAHRHHLILLFIGDGDSKSSRHFPEKVVLSAIAVKVEQGLGIAARVQMLWS